MRCIICGTKGKHFLNKICPDCVEAGKSPNDANIIRTEERLRDNQRKQNALLGLQKDLKAQEKEIIEEQNFWVNMKKEEEKLKKEAKEGRKHVSSKQT